VATFYRLTPGGTSVFDHYQSANLFLPEWLKLVRAGDVMTTFYSADGLNWIQLGTSTVPLPATLYVGLAVTSHSDGVLCTANFDHLNLDDAPPSTLVAYPRAGVQVDLVWADNSARETGFQIERSTDNAAFALVGTVAADALGFTDLGVAAATTYFYRVRYTSPAGPSAYSNVASVTTTAAAPAGWTSTDIGAPVAAGEMTGVIGAFTVRGSGAGVGGLNFNHESQYRGDYSYTVFGAYDQFQLASQSWTDDGDLSAQVTGLSGPATGLAGIMLRDGLDSGAVNVCLAVQPGGVVVLTARTGVSPTDTRQKNQTTTLARLVGLPLPRWLRLTRNTGTVSAFTAYQSADGTNWSVVGSASFPTGPRLDAGLAVTSGSDGTMATGTFDHVALTASATTATPPTAPTGLTAAPLGSTLIVLGWTDASSTESGFEIQRSLDNVTFTTLVTVGVNYNYYYDSAVSPGTTYYYRVRAALNATPSAFTATASATTDPVVPVITWSGGDIGTVGGAGADSIAAGVYTVQGSGADIWGAADAFHFARQEWTGDGTFTARLTGLTNTDGWAKAGIMLREDLTAGARYAAIFGNPGGNAAQQARTVAGGASTFAFGVYESAPLWLRLVRSGNQFQTFQSADGTNWTQVGPNVTLSLPTTLLLGLAVTSHNAAAVATATFDQVSFVSGVAVPVPPPVINAPSGLTATTATAGEIDLAWTDLSSNETGFEIQYSVDGTNFLLAGTVAADVTHYADASLAASTQYYYRVRAIVGSGASGYSNVATATTPAAPAAAWIEADIGAVGVPGSGSVAGDQVTVTGSGTDIWATVDAFRYAYQAWHGDGEIVARVASLGNTDPFAKAGVMFRESLALNARNAFMFLTATQGTAFQGRATPGGATSFMHGDWGVTQPYWVRLTRAGDTFTGYSSVDGVSWVLISSQTISMPADIYVGLAVTAHNNAATTTGLFTNVAASGPAVIPAASPEAWAHTDIGNVGLVGGFDMSGGVLSVDGSGADIWGNADALQYVYLPWVGDVEVVAQVTGLENTDPWAKAGVMIRETLAADARNALVYLTPNNGVGYQSRLETGGSSGAVSGLWWAKAPYWVRLVRRGNSFSAFTSPDGVAWTLVTTETIAMPASVFVGFAVTPHRVSFINHATFTEFGVDLP